MARRYFNRLRGRAVCALCGVLRGTARLTAQRATCRAAPACAFQRMAAILPEYLQHGGRRLQHRMAWSLAGAALLLALGQGVATAATITVSTNDPRIIPDGQCSLVEAIVNANNDAATHADCPSGSGADTIVLPANTYMVLSNAYVSTPFGTTFPVQRFGLPLITSRITIEGNGATIHRDKNAPAFGLIGVGNFPPPPTPGDLTLQNVTLSGGSSQGGVSNNSGLLTIQNSIISGNTGAGVSNFGGFSSGGNLSIKNSTISGNAGGGVSNIYGTLTIENSTVSNNTGGGGVSNFDGSLTIANSTISGNQANQGGGVNQTGGFLTITNSTISGNRANAGGGIFNTCNPYFLCGPGTLTLNNSLIAGNQAAIAPEIENVGTSSILGPSIVNANNFNLFGSNGNAGVSGFTPGPTDIVPSVGLAQILRSVKNNGSPTQTHALVAGSPAVDAGDPGGCRDSQGALLSTDQRGFARHVDGNNDGTARCDIGAVEGVGGAAIPLIDFDGDGTTDIAVYRNGTWFVLRSSDGGVRATEWGGLPHDKPVPGDYDGDGKVDHAVYRDGTWFVIQSSDGEVRSTGWGGLPQDIPLPADFDGDGKTDIAVYRDGIWFIIRSSDGEVRATGWGGVPQDIPLPADYDGDGKADIAVYRDGTWFILRSADGEVRAPGWGGVLADKPVPADYDGDGKADIAVYRDGTWFILRSSDGGQTTVSWGGLPQDLPVPADYDGDGKVDIAVYRDGIWFIIRSSDGMQTSVGWGGLPEDIPLK
jgi:hypothetical protein